MMNEKGKNKKAFSLRLSAIGVMLITLVWLPEAQAQVVRIEDVLFGGSSKAYARITTTAGSDSVVGIPIVYTGSVYPDMVGQYPDSIIASFYVTADSTYRIFIRQKSATRYGQIASAYTSVLLDSLVSATAAVTVKRVVITTPKYFGYDLLGLSLIGKATIEYGNAVMPANASKVYVKYVRYFHRR